MARSVLHPTDHRAPVAAPIIVVLGTALGACGPDTPDSGIVDQRPQRIVSLDYCADQYVLKFVEPARILAVSPDAGRDFSYMRDYAAGLPSVRPVAEDVIVLKPDLVVRAYGGGPQAPAMFERAGVRVHNIGWPENIEAVMRMIEDTARVLGSGRKGLATVAEMQERLASLRHPDRPASALYLTPAGVTSGPGSLVHELIAVAGLVNFQTRPGWGPIPLERLAYEQPDLIAAGFFDTLTKHPHRWSAIRHPVARAQLDGGAVVTIDGAWTACGAWFLVDAVEALARGPAP